MTWPSGDSGPRMPALPTRMSSFVPALVDGGSQRVDLVVVLEVEGEQGGLAAQRPDLVVDLLQRTGGAPDQDQVRALLA